MPIKSTNKYDVVLRMLEKAEDHIEFGRYVEVLNQFETPADSSDVERENSKQENKIILKNDRIIITNKSSGDEFEINPDNYSDTMKILDLLEDEQLEALSQIANKMMSKNTSFKTLIAGVNSQKNIVKGNISNVNEVKIGDETQYHFHYYRVIKKEVTTNKNISINIKT